jgi:hypothetical protein
MMKLFHEVRGFADKFWKEHLVLALYLALTLALLYPFSVLNMGTQLIGDGGDGYQSLWNLWWVKQSALALHNPFQTNLLFYPTGADLYAHSLSPAAGFLTIPFQAVAGVVFSYNLIVIASFVLAGSGMYRLARHITVDKRASFFAGLVFAFSSYHFARAFEHLSLVSIEWIPFYVLFLLKMRTEKSLRNVAWAAVFLSLTALMADLQYVAFLGLFTLFYVLYVFVWDRRMVGRFLLRLGAMFAVFAVVLLLVFSPLIFGLISGKYAYASASPQDSVAFSADLLSFFTPSPLNFIGGPASGVVASFATSAMHPIEGITYLGFTVLALATFAVFKLRRASCPWLLGSLAFLVLALGPVLHVAGASVFSSFRVNVPLPEQLLYYVLPVFRAPARMVVMATLCLAVVSALSLKRLNTWTTTLKNGKKIGLIFIVALSAAFLAECSMVPFPVVQDNSVPQFYSDLANVSGDFCVLDLPQDYASNNLYMYYATVSGKALVSGSISRPSPENVLLPQAIPVIGQTASDLTGVGLTAPTNILTQDLNQTNLNAFEFFKIRYVILHKNLMDRVDFEIMKTYLAGLAGAPVYEDEKIAAFEVHPAALNGLFAYLSRGWWNLEKKDLQQTRWMEKNSTITVLSPLPQYCSIKFQAGTENTNKTLQVLLNGEVLSDLQISTGTRTAASFVGFLKAGANVLAFRANETFIPEYVTAGTLDNRELSVYLQNVTITSG